MFEKTEPIV